MLVAKDDHLSAAGYCLTIFAAGGGGTTCASLREDDFAHAVAIADCIADVGKHTGHLSFFGGKNSLVGEEKFEEHQPLESGSRRTPSAGSSVFQTPNRWPARASAA